MIKYLARLNEIIQQKPIPTPVPKVPKAPSVTFGTGDGKRVSGIDRPPYPGEVEERKAMAADNVPEPYLDAWTRLQCQKPMGVSDAEWRQAIDDAGRFIDQWGSLALELGWTAGDIFDVPRDGKPGGLAWFQKGECVRSLGPEHAVLGGGERVFDKLTRGEWISSYEKGKCR